VRAGLRIWQFRGALFVGWCHSRDILSAFILGIQHQIVINLCRIGRWHLFCTGRPFVNLSGGLELFTLQLTARVL
jgi:hypothetical protein